MTNFKSSRAAVEDSLQKVESIDRSGYELNSVLALTPDVELQADAYDKTGLQLPLNGFPILIKDNIEAIGLPGTAGSLALSDTEVRQDSPLVARLRKAGAIVIGSTNLSEWANIRSDKSTSGWSAVGGLTANPWIHMHSAGGSSAGSGAAVAAGLSRFAIGSETDGSITCPASLNGCVGIKPTVGSVPRAGMVPISASQDSPGPMTQTVADAALLLEIMMGRSGLVAATKDWSGIRIGVVRSWLTNNDKTNSLFESSVSTLARAGIHLLDVDLVEPDENIGEDEFDVLLHELVSDLGDYLQARHGSRVKSLADVVAFNAQNAETELAFFGQELFEKALQLGGRGLAHQEKRARNLAWANQTIHRALLDVDVVIGCTYAPAWVSKLGEGDDFSSASWISTAPSIAGAPIGTLPMGLVDGLPVGLGVVARNGEESKLLSAMAAIEHRLDIGVLQPTFNRRPA
ncbi:MAG TPA: amidase family protein [Candidatus Nanopelagicaceae bacterium]|nr:amidase family protein [Candidatus Nanopelagicaceae bacterium]